MDPGCTLIVTCPWKLVNRWDRSYWMTSTRNGYSCQRGNGILVFDHGADIDNTADDMSRVLGVGAGNGNLPVAYVNCLVKDLDGEIWAGTNERYPFYNPASVMDGGTIADAAQPLVNLGGYNEYLLSKEIVNCITVDGANRKWIGTNSGVFLISADGTEQLLF